jgi:hypothetical protein
MTDQWLGDEADEELPILPASDAPVAPRAPRKRRRRSFPTKGIPVAQAGDARRELLAEATGRGQQEPEQWREELANGQRDRAASSLRSARGRGSGSGFGLA